MNKVVIFAKDNYEFVVFMSLFVALVFVFCVNIVLPKIGAEDVIRMPSNEMQIDYNLLNSLPIYYI